MLDFYLGRGHQRPALWDGPKDVTSKIYRLAKRNKSPLLQYFQINYSAEGKEQISAILPPAFEGHILKQLEGVLNNEH